MIDKRRNNNSKYRRRQKRSRDKLLQIMKKISRCRLLKKKLKGHPQILTTSIALNLLKKIMLKSQKHSSSTD